jgi:hypothetical protein
MRDGSSWQQRARVLAHDFRLSETLSGERLPYSLHFSFGDVWTNEHEMPASPAIRATECRQSGPPELLDHRRRPVGPSERTHLNGEPIDQCERADCGLGGSIRDESGSR